MTTGLGLSFEGGDGAASVAAAAPLVESAGVETIWLANHLFQRDPSVLAAAALAATRRVRAGLMSMSPYSMHPVQAVMAAATLNEQFPGRVLLSFGTGAPGDLDAAGIGRPAPLATLRESLEMARALLTGEAVRFKGRRFHLAGRAMVTGAQPMPVMLAATGPRMLRLAGELADGVQLSAATSPGFVRWQLEQVAEGAKGRALRRIGLVLVSVDQNARRAYDRLRRLLAFILRGAHHAPNIAMGGTALDQAALAAAVSAGDWDRACSLVTDEVVARHSASGTPDEARARLAAYREAGLDEIVLVGLGTGLQLRAALAALSPDRQAKEPRP